MIITYSAKPIRRGEDAFLIFLSNMIYDSNTVNVTFFRNDEICCVY